jgi:hypothetical protein
LTPEETEKAFFSTFIRRERADRYVALLRTARRREKILAELHHFHDFDGQHVWQPPREADAPLPLYEILRRTGAPETCYLIGGGSHDGEYMDLRNALDRFHGTGAGMIICCIPNRLAWYEGEDQRFVLHRSP